jgi:hypothetical protein
VARRERPVRWSVDVLPAGNELPDDLKTAVLGSRTKILFVEDVHKSLDLPIYAILFPRISVVPKGGCVEVMRAVDGLRNTPAAHWVEAFGLIDRDDRAEKELDEFIACGIHGLQHYSVESLYFSEVARRFLAERQAAVHGADAVTMLGRAKSAALVVLGEEETVRRLCARRCERKLRNVVAAEIPSWKEILLGDGSELKISVYSPLREEIAICRQYSDNEELDGLISRYPVRETSALHKIADELEFKNKNKYMQAVIAALSADEEMRNAMRDLLGTLRDQLR